ncbi:MAG: hypothetical protein CMJ18_15595 [Phycisphaeraceae bacterium]|nr:hypothetical protein [Phycisphaeraceae bacterium]
MNGAKEMRTDLRQRILDLPLTIVGAPLLLAGYVLYFCLNLKHRAEAHAQAQPRTAGNANLALSVQS